MGSPLELIFLLFLSIGGLFLAYLIKLPLAVGFLLGLSYLFYLARKRQTSWPDLLAAIVKGMSKTKGVLLILLLVGLLIPAWTAAGTITLLIKLGLSCLNVHYFLTSSFLITAAISFLLGTSTGALSTVGIALMGAGAVLGIPLAMAAGAIVSGAFVGDRTSPLSSANQLVASCTGVTREQQNKALLPTTFWALVLALLFFLQLDYLNHFNAAFNQSTDLSQHFQLSPWLLLPPILIGAGIALRLPVPYAFLFSIVSALILGTSKQGILPGQWLDFLLHGYQTASTTVLPSKGVLAMLPMMALIAVTGAYNGILEKTKLIQPYLRNILGRSSTLGSASLRVCLLGLLLNVLACNQTLPIMLSAINLKPLWQERFPLEKLARLVADSSLVLAGLVPWNMLAILCTTILGVDTLAYLPYAVFLWLLPILTIGLSLIEERGIKKCLN